MQKPQEMQVQSQSGEDPLEEEMATYFSVLAWKFPWTVEPKSYSPWGCEELATTDTLSLSLEREE